MNLPNSNHIQWTVTNYAKIHTGRHRKDQRVCSMFPAQHFGPYVTVSGTEYCETCGGSVSKQYMPYVEPFTQPMGGCTCYTTAGYYCPVHGYRYGQQPVIWCGNTTPNSGLQVVAN